MQLNRVGLHLIHFFEGLRLTGYRDSGGKPTIGWGHLVLQHEMARYGPGKTITREEAVALFTSDLNRITAGVREALKVTVNSNMFSALVAFAFNLGVNALRTSTLMRLINEGKVAQATAQFELWDNVDIDPRPEVRTLREEKGLVSRRKCEQFLFTLPEEA